MKRILTALLSLALSWPTLVFAARPDTRSTPARSGACTAYLSAPGPLPTWLEPGAVLCLHAGDYPHGQLRILAADVTYRSAPGELARLVGVGSLELNGSGFTLSGLEIDGGGVGVPAIVMRGDNQTLSENEIHHGRYNGVDVRGINARIEANHIHDFDSGVPGDDAQCVNVLPTGANVTVVANTIHDCSGDGLQAFYSNSLAQPVPDLAGGLIANNVFTRGTLAYTENAIDLKRGAGWIIYGNAISGYGREPVALIRGGNPSVIIHKWTSGVLFTDNLVQDSAKGVHLFGNAGLDAGAAPISITVRGNTFIGVGPGYVITSTGALGVTLGPNAVYANDLPIAPPTATPNDNCPSDADRRSDAVRQEHCDTYAYDRR